MFRTADFKKIDLKSYKKFLQKMRNRYTIKGKLMNQRRRK